MKAKQINLKIPESLFKIADDYVLKFGYRNIQDLIYEGLREKIFIDKEKLNVTYNPNTELTTQPPKRQAKKERKSKETDINIDLDIDGLGEYKINTPIRFLNHMLEGFTKHGLFDLKIDARGDLEIDQHHTIEDLGIVLGETFRKALGDMKGINRSGFFAFPMDESLGIVAIDVSGRTSTIFNAKFQRKNAGDLDLDLVEDFFIGFSMGLGCNIAVYVPYGRNDHHKLEAIFKAFGKALASACQKNRAKDKIPSTKELLDFMGK